MSIDAVMSTTVIEHWRGVYRDKREAQTSWFRPHLDTSLRLIDGLGLAKQTPLIDVGGGRSTLVDDLLARGFCDVTVLDIAERALAEAQVRLSAAGRSVSWLAADVLAADFPAARFGLWHDRAAFHFLTDAESRNAYVERAAAALKPGGHAIVATFAVDGPERCSNLPVRRYDAAALAAEFAPWFDAIDSAREDHTTPWGATQAFTYVVLRRTETRNERPC